MEPNKRPPSTFRLLFILIVASLLCVGSVLVWADFQCSSDIEAWLPLYPNAETVSVENDLFRPRATGTTLWIQESTDDIETIKQFYRDHVLEVLDSKRGRGLASTDWQVEPNSESNTNRIILFSSCGI